MNLEIFLYFGRWFDMMAPRSYQMELVLRLFLSAIVCRGKNELSIATLKRVLSHFKIAVL